MSARFRRRPARLGAVGATVLMLITGVSSAASAHVAPEPPDAQAGSLLVVGFTVEHGCAGSPTVRLDMRLPDGVTDPAPDAIEGWVSSIEGAVVRFDGGRLADDRPLTFTVRMRLPLTPETTVYFPFVQRCEVGEIRWIQTPDNSTAALDEPAPAMRLIGPVAEQPSTTTTTSEASIAEVTPVAPTTAVSNTSASQTALATTTAVALSTSVSRNAARTETGSGNGVAGTWVFVGLLAALGAIGFFAAREARRGRR